MLILLSGCQVIPIVFPSMALVSIPTNKVYGFFILHILANTHYKYLLSFGMGTEWIGQVDRANVRLIFHCVSISFTMFFFT